MTRKNIRYAFCALVAFCTVLSLPLNAVHAESFTANKIIDDSVFDNVGTMTATQIDAFLNTFPSSCISPNSGFAAIDPTGYNPINGYLYGGYVTAGQVIYDAAQAYTINPQVILTTLQKEQSLVAGGTNFCENGDMNKYSAAVGYGCPDSGSTYSYTGLSLYRRNGVVRSSTGQTCVNSAAKAGFSQQVIRAAWLLKFGEQRSEGNTGWAVIKGSWNNSDDPQTCYGGPMTQGTWVRCPSGGSAYYDGYTTIDGSAVHMDDGPTAALYWYTPHFSGNQHFYDIFTSWFGSVRGTPFFQISGSVKTYMLGANNTYYYITSPDIMKAYGYGTAFSRIDQENSTYISGMTFNGNLPLVARFEGDPVYAVANGQAHSFPDRTTFEDYGYVFGNEAALPAWTLKSLPIKESMTHILRQSDNNTIYSISGGKANPFCSWSAYTTLGDPIYSTQPSVTLNSLYASTLTLGAPIATDGSLIHAPDTNKYGIWNGTQLAYMDTAVAQATGLTSCEAPDSSLQQLTTSPAAVSNLVKDSSGTPFIIDGNRKLTIPSSQQAHLAIPSGSFQTVNDTFLSRLSTSPMASLYRVNNTDAVFDIISGKSYAITSRDDLTGLGYELSQVISIAPTTSNLFPSGGTLFKPGRVVRIGSQDTVYLIDANFQMHPFPSAGVFADYGYTFNQVVSVPASALQSYTTGLPVAAVAKDSGGAYWLIDKGSRHKLSSTLAGASGFNITSANSISLSDALLSNFPATSDLTAVFRADNTDPVYIIENGEKQQFMSPAALLNAGYAWSDVMSLSASFVNSLPTGTPIN